MSELTDFRKAKDDFFKNESQSPLDFTQKKTFAGLNYYPENPQLRFDLLLEKSGAAEHVVMATSTGDEQEYMHVGQIRFTVEGREAFLQPRPPGGRHVGVPHAHEHPGGYPGVANLFRRVHDKGVVRD